MSTFWLDWASTLVGALSIAVCALLLYLLDVKKRTIIGRMTVLFATLLFLMVWLNVGAIAHKYAPPGLPISPSFIPQILLSSFALAMSILVQVEVLLPELRYIATKLYKLIRR